MLDATIGDKATGFHKPRSDSASSDSGYMQPGNESVVKSLKVGCLAHIGWCCVCVHSRFGKEIHFIL